MSAYTNDEKDQLPPLIPLKRRRAEQQPLAQTPIDKDKASVMNTDMLQASKAKDLVRKS
jgi:hypothetical protein